MRHSIILTVILLAVQSTVLTVDALDLKALLTKSVEKLLPPRSNNNDKAVDGLKKDNELLKLENDKLIESLDQEKEARELAEKSLQEEQILNESLRQEIGNLQKQLFEAQQLIETCNQKYGNCTGENEVLSANIEQFRYSLEKCEQDKQNEIKKLNEEINNVRGDVHDCENSLSSCRRDYDDFVAIAIERQSKLSASLQSAAAESSAIEASYALLVRTT